MARITRYPAVVLLVIDGLRPDAVRPDLMPALSALAERYWSAGRAETVAPSVTVAALSSLATGVAPRTHGLVRPGVGALRRLGDLIPLPAHLRRHGIPTRIIIGDVPGPQLLIARALLSATGVSALAMGGRDPAAVGATAVVAARREPRGLTVVYLNDCDRAGHASGWMSGPYLEAATRCDRAVARLAALIAGGQALLCVTADHGGGGVEPRDHDLPHPTNTAIPLILAGRGLRDRTRSDRGAHLLDIPPTLLAALGVPVPTSYEGRVLSEAFSWAAAA